MGNIFQKSISKLVKLATGSYLAQKATTASEESLCDNKLGELVRNASAEGIVLLKNDGVLPLKNKIVSVFGRCQFDYFYVGYGSGGDVNAPYKINLACGLKACNSITLNENLLDTYLRFCNQNIPDEGFWGHWPMCYDEMPVDEELAIKAGNESDVAVVVIGRAAGEDRENKLEKGSYYLTDTELLMLDNVTKAFDKVVVVMNCGNIIDMSWTKKYGKNISAILYAWQGGMEAGNSVADILCGKVNPSGKLPDTIANCYEDYPSADNFGGKEFNNYAEDIFVGYKYFETFAKDKVLYPFGFGLSYTQFEQKVLLFEATKKNIKMQISIKNIGKYAGKQVVQIYVGIPQGLLGKPSISLVAFDKTKLLEPQDEQVLNIEFDAYSYASFDDIGVTGFKNSYVLESGVYKFYIGENCRDINLCGKFELDKLEVIKTLKSVCPVKNPFERIVAKSDNQIADKNADNAIIVKAEMQEVECGEQNLKDRILTNLPQTIGFYKNEYNFDSVRKGEITLAQFVGSLSNDDLIALSCGEGRMNSKLGVSGNAGAFGGITNKLRSKGVPAIICADGPAGIRLNKICSLLPCGTNVASSWNVKLAEQLYLSVAKEMAENKVDVLLAPGMNIHRNVLCGRNFEYFSEDSLLCGKMASGVVKGIQSSGLGASPKHFACNNQEIKRNSNDSRVSVRALREIYLKPFEICVSEAKPKTIMTSYNKLNGVWNHYNYDLVTTILREEWGFGGMVITDWWMRKSKSIEFPNLENNAYRVRSQVDVLMPGGINYLSKSFKTDRSLKKALKAKDGLTRGELERGAINVLNTILNINNN